MKLIYLLLVLLFCTLNIVAKERNQSQPIMTQTDSISDDRVEYRFALGVQLGTDIGGAIPFPFSNVPDVFNPYPKLSPSIGAKLTFPVTKKWTLGAEVTYKKVAIDADARIEFATDNSQLSRAATLFVCKGASFKREYLLQAIETGAVAYVSEIDYGVDIPCIIVRRTLGCLADMAYDHPSGKVGVCAFTGTKGKTTSAYYLKGVLDAHARLAGCHTSALFSSVEFDDGVESGISKLTTPESFASAFECGCKWLRARDHGGVEPGTQV